jgi:hypothetical protein
MVILPGIFIPSCKVIQFQPIGDRVPVRESIRISDENRISSTGPVFMNKMGIVKADFWAMGYGPDP